MHRRLISTIAMLMVMTICITGCTSEASNIGVAKGKGQVVDTGFTVTTAGSYDSADTAVVISTDQENSAVVFMNMETGKQYTLYYDGTTYVKDKHDGPMTISQIEPGDVVDVQFLKGKKRLASIKRSPQAWVYDEIVNYNLGGANKTASIGSNTYSLPDDVVVMSEGRRSEVMDVIAQDVVTISGIDHKIYSISVDRGHGYLRLKNDQALIGGWIEVGNSVIREITEDMLLVVPEGSYQVLLSNNGVSCTKDVVIERNKEVVLDVGDLEIAENKTGRILFSVTPDTAKVSIDGKAVDISKAVELPYGIHQIHLEAKGYDSLTKYIQVGSEFATISFELEEEREEENRRTVSSNAAEDYVPEAEPEEDQSSLSENALGATKGNKVYIDSPRNVEVYLDGNYIGLSPVSFGKTVGSHTVTLRKTGYETKSYTIYLYNDGQDTTYSFSDLVAKTVSGNSTKPDNDSSNKENLVTVHIKLDIEGVNVYVDGTKKGTTDSTLNSIDFEVKAGLHTILLSKTGYDAKDYEIEIDGKEKEVTYTRKDFPGFGNSVSGNDSENNNENCEHDYEEEIVKDATCTEAGEKKYTCKECGNIRTEEIPATEHNYVEEVTKEPTCTEVGEKKEICKECEDIRSTEEIPATGHKFEGGKCTVCEEKDPDYDENEEGSGNSKPDNTGGDSDNSNPDSDTTKEDLENPDANDAEEDSDNSGNKTTGTQTSAGSTTTTQRIVQNSSSRRKR